MIEYNAIFVQKVVRRCHWCLLVSRNKFTCPWCGSLKAWNLKPKARVGFLIILILSFLFMRLSGFNVRFRKSWSVKYLIFLDLLFLAVVFSWIWASDQFLAAAIGQLPHRWSMHFFLQTDIFYTLVYNVPKTLHTTAHIFELRSKGDSQT